MQTSHSAATGSPKGEEGHWEPVKDEENPENPEQKPDEEKPETPEQKPDEETPETPEPKPEEQIPEKPDDSNTDNKQDSTEDTSKDKTNNKADNKTDSTKNWRPNQSCLPCYFCRQCPSWRCKSEIQKKKIITIKREVRNAEPLLLSFL